MEKVKNTKATSHKGHIFEVIQDWSEVNLKHWPFETYDPGKYRQRVSVCTCGVVRIIYRHAPVVENGIRRVNENHRNPLPFLYMLNDRILSWVEVCPKSLESDGID